MYAREGMGPSGQGWTTGLVGLGQPLTASQGWTTGRVSLAQAPSQMDIFKQEARAYIERLFGSAYELIPESVRREIERRYIETRMEELGIPERLEIAKKVLPVVPILIGAAFLLLRR